MATVVTRTSKGSPLSNAEMDANLNNLNSDKLEYVTVANAAALPGTGASNVLYVTLDNNKTHRWNGATYDIIGATSIVAEVVTALPGTPDANTLYIVTGV